MAVVLKLRKIDNSVGFTLPREELTRLNLDVGDEVFLVPEDGGLRIEVYDPEFAKKVKVMRAGAKQYRNALRELGR